MYCRNCGKQIDDNAVVCVNCGASVANFTPIQADRPDIGFALIGFFIPIAGLILYLVERDTRPKRAASAGKGALISVILSAVGSILVFVLYFVLMLSYM